MSTLPSWLVKLAVGAVVTAIIGGGIGWVSNTSATDATQSSEIAVIKNDQKHVTEDIKEIKESQLRIEAKIDKALREE